MKQYLKMFRVTHYVKNLLLFAPLFFARRLFDLKALALLAYMSIPFCLITSVIYIINDINDVEKDRRHPKKCKRPIASGAISIRAAKTSAVVLLLIIFAMVCAAAAMGDFHYISLFWLIVYVIINYMYSRGMKDIPILDVTILAAGYLIRLFYGASVVEVVVSPWLYLTVLAGAFYLGMGKRRNEMRNLTGENTRKVLKLYSYEFLDKNMHMCVGLAITFYSLWAIQTEYPGMIWTVPIVMIILMKYSLDIESGDSEGNPMDVFTHDRVLLALAAVYVVAVCIVLYFI